MNYLIYIAKHPYTEDDAHNMVPKVHAVKQKIEHINSNVNVQTYYQEIDSTTIEDILKAVNPDIVIDGMDHFKIRYLINEVVTNTIAAVGSKGTVTALILATLFEMFIKTHSNQCRELCYYYYRQITQVSYEVTEAIRYLSGHGFFIS